MKLVIRADASTQIGTGHVMRCLALAQAWQDAGGDVVFIMATKAPLLEARLKSEGIEVVYITAPIGSVEDARETVNLARKFNANWVVLDGYNFGGEYQKIIKDDGLRLLMIDDEGKLEHYYADYILSQNICADESWYLNREQNTKVLIGMQYVLLRKEFWEWQGYLRNTPRFAQKILITLGGSDSNNVTIKIIQALLQLEDTENLEAILVLGGGNPHYKQIQLVTQNIPFSIRLERNVTNIPELMAWADMAITGGGTTNLEMAFMGLPSLAIILAKNQQLSVEKLDNIGVCINLGWHDTLGVSSIESFITQLKLTSNWRMGMTQAGKNLIDGRGCERVLSSMMDYD